MSLPRRHWHRGLLALVLIALTGAGGAAPSQPASKKTAGSVVSRQRSPVQKVTLQGVPAIVQLPNYCGPAALSSVFAYWGRSIPQTAIGQKVYDRRLSATNGADLLLYAREEGFAAYTYLSSFRDLKERIQAGYPVLVLQEMSLRDSRGHFRVVIGFDDSARRFLVRDTNFDAVRTIPYDEFEKIWSAFSRWALIVCPREKETGLESYVRNNPVLHLDLGQAYLRRRKEQLARRHFEETLRLEPRNEEAMDQLALIGAGPSLPLRESP
ncbi:MAG: C39 family peptidase [Armatimonadetes bacterium]|nr:C39 family peptidase [Armatimonadota bacterium]